MIRTLPQNEQVSRSRFSPFVNKSHVCFQVEADSRFRSDYCLDDFHSFDKSCTTFKSAGHPSHDRYLGVVALVQAQAGDE